MNKNQVVKAASEIATMFNGKVILAGGAELVGLGARNSCDRLEFRVCTNMSHPGEGWESVIGRLDTWEKWNVEIAFESVYLLGGLQTYEFNEQVFVETLPEVIKRYASCIEKPYCTAETKAGYIALLAVEQDINGTYDDILKRASGK